jgi:hypothetical protein
MESTQSSSVSPIIISSQSLLEAVKLIRGHKNDNRGEVIHPQVVEKMASTITVKNNLTYT